MYIYNVYIYIQGYNLLPARPQQKHASPTPAYIYTPAVSD